VVVENSQRVPVLVDFWADWCQPCQTLTPLLTKLAQEYRGGFILAKVNADAEQALAAHFQVRSLPTVMVVWQGQIVEQLVGAQPESAYREIIDQFRAQSRTTRFWSRSKRSGSAVARNRPSNCCGEALKQEPDSVELKVALADKLLQLDRTEEARNLLQSLPAEERDRQPASGMLARLQFADLAQGAPDLAKLEAQICAKPDDCAARRQLAARYVLAGELRSGAGAVHGHPAPQSPVRGRRRSQGLDRDLRNARQ
jgi:putative thioredoxin